jgi:hypothetical protein
LPAVAGAMSISLPKAHYFSIELGALDPSYRACGCSIQSK